MPVESVQDKGGAPRARVICDFCDREETVPCGYARTGSSNGAVVKESQARAKAIKMNWSYVKNKLRCPECTRKRKVVKMQVVKKDDTPREPTQKQRVAIFALLADVYDMDAGCYSQGDTDDTVAGVLNVMPGWVAQIRDKEFGPAGNEDMEALEKKITETAEALQAEIKAGTERNDRLIVGLQAVQDVRASYEKIKKAVGVRIQKKAGI